VTNYNNIFFKEHHKIKKILTRQNQTIFPQEIKAIQKSIDRINEKYVRWRHELEAFMRRANVELLRKQGYTMKRYKAMMASTDHRVDIKLFEDDEEITDLMKDFRGWIKIFNDLELKYGNVIFYQKRIINNPNDTESVEKLRNLLEELKML
jgi:hypothetical protein